MRPSIAACRALVADGLGVVALDPAARRLDVARVGVGDVDLPLRCRRRRVGRRRLAEAAAVLHHSACAVGLVIGVRALLDLVVFLEPPLRLGQPFRPRARDRPGLGSSLLVKPALRLAQPAAPPLRSRELRRQLVAAAIAEPLILLRVDSGGLFEDLCCDLLVSRASRDAMRSHSPSTQSRSRPGRSGHLPLRRFFFACRA